MSGRDWRRGRVWLGVALGLLLLGGGILFFVRPPRPERPRVAPPARDAASQSTDDEEFVGSESCAACHNRIWESYRRHPMGQSLATPRYKRRGGAGRPEPGWLNPLLFD